jgi:PAS domain S-box-containing protein
MNDTPPPDPSATDPARYRLIVETIPHFVWVARPDGSIEYMNRLCLEYVGITAGAVPGWDWLSIVHPADLSRAAAAWGHSVRTGTPYRVEYRLRRADGAYRWFVARGEPLRDDRRAVVRWFGTCTDIDDQKRAEEALRASEARFRAIVERSADGFALMAPDRTVRYVSPAVARILGHAPEEFVGKDAWEWAHPDDRAGLSVWLAHLLTDPGGTVEVWYRFRHRDGSYRQLDIAATNMLADPDVGAVVVTFREIATAGGRPGRPRSV